MQTDEILQKLYTLFAAGETVTLHNLFKGLAISNDAKIIRMEGSAAWFSVPRFQATCLELHRRTYIQSEYLPLIARASVVSVNFIESTALLTAFVYTGSDIGNRRSMRVHPREETPLEMTIKGLNIKGHLADISNDGLGIWTSATFYGPAVFASHTPIVVNLSLEPKKPPLRLPGTVMNVTKISETYRLGVSTTADPANRLAVVQYVSQRQAELQRELRLMSDMFFQIAAGKGGALP